ncbi:hypothetical protein HmCmsJML217_00200 [Escherichia coli]|nr:hypothetical protein HmCmsJML217_00200 [Escherichia coli]
MIVVKKLQIIKIKVKSIAIWINRPICFYFPIFIETSIAIKVIIDIVHEIHFIKIYFISYIFFSIVQNIVYDIFYSFIIKLKIFYIITRHDVMQIN